MNKILLNILMFVGFQQFILGTEINKKPEPKKGVCLFCHTNCCDHNIDDPEYENCPECVKEVYSVCHLGHTMCANCIYDFVDDGLKSDRGIIKCVCFDVKKPIGGKNFESCGDLIDKNVVIQIFDILQMEKKEKEKLRKKYIAMQNKLISDILFLEPQKERCKYKGCPGYFDVTKGFICNKNNSHKHCGNCFDRIHTEECKNPLESEDYKFCIQQNEEIHKKIKKGELKEGDTEGYKPCPNCHQIIAKERGCNHITCGKHYGGENWHGKGCGYQWCWRCGKACFCDNYDKGEPGNNHYNYNEGNNSCYGKHYVNRTSGDPDYFDDGDYFGIKNGKFKEQFKKLAEDMLVGVEVETPTNKYKDIKIINWNSIIEARKKYQEEHPENHYAVKKKTKKQNYAVDDSKNCCTECCSYIFTFFR